MREVHGACPLDCPDACAWTLTVDGSQPVKLRARKDHPYTQGQLCRKVNPWLEYAADPSRLTTPLRRTGAKGDGDFEPIGWDDAIGEMADRLSTIVHRSGGAAVWPFVGTGTLGWIQGLNGPHRLWSHMGASAHNMSICSVAGRDGINLAVGTGAWLDPEDFAQAGLIVLWGTNTRDTNSHLWLIIDEARRRGVEVIAIDPIRTRTAAAADVHLAPLPGTDAALALGLCRLLVERGGHDAEFLADRTVGADGFIDSVQGWTVEATASVTGLTTAEIHDLADRVMAAPPLALRIGHGVQRHAGGGQAMRAVACVPAITGAYAQTGGGALYSSSGTPKGYNLDRSRRPGPAGPPRTLTHTRLGHHLLGTDDPRVEALIVSGANPAVSNPGLPLVREGLRRDDLFTVVIDIFPTETAAYADLVLPSTMQHEHHELIDAYNHRYLHWNEAAVPPVGDCLPHTEILRRLATAMGYDDPALQASDLELAADLLDSDELRRAGITLERLRAEGFLPLPAVAPPAERPFPTPSGRFEFHSDRAAAAGLGALPHYLPPWEANTTGLSLVAPADAAHVNSTFAGTQRVRSRSSDPAVVLHPGDAVSRGIRPGDRVRVHNQRGAFEATAEVSPSITRPGVVATTKGRWAHPINDTVAERDADMGGGAIFHDNAVEVEPARPDPIS